MRIRTIALNTFGSFFHNRLLLLFLALFVCVVLLMMLPLLGMKAVATAENAQVIQGEVLSLVGAIMYLLSGFGSLLAAWAAVDAVGGEMKSGTILAVMARPVRRWEFLAGKYLGVQLLMVIYVLSMFAMSYLLAWMGGERIFSTPWVMIIYPLVRYAVYTAVAMLLVSFMHPLFAMALVLVMATLATLVSPANTHAFPEWLRTPLWILLPSTELLSESRFFVITASALKKVTALEHLTSLAYGLNYALMLFMLAVWSFRNRSLSRD
jgi:ABC-type transport system involved in multi-copper enzyme maturation permease subunit